MKRSIVIHHSHEHQQANESSQQRKRSLDESNLMTKVKKRRHLSPQHETKKKKKKKISLPSVEKKKKKKHSSSTSPSKSKKKTSRKSSSRRHSFSTEHFNEITLPNWERISPNIDQILSNKHTQSGVYAHEVHLIQQELEALLSMSIVRENLLLDLRHPKKAIDHEKRRSTIRQHQQAEHIYSSKETPSKPLSPLVNHQHPRNDDPNLYLDRQVAMAPIIGARIDQIWSDINTFYHQISSNDISMIENLVEFNQELGEKMHQFKTEYRNRILTPVNITEQLNEENFENLLNITQTNPLITHYIDRTTIGRFQRRLYEHVPHTSPVYKTPISSPFYKKTLANQLDSHSSLRISPRLHSNYRLGLFSLPNSKASDIDSDKTKKKTKTTLITPPSSIELQERVQLVRDYLTDQHPLVPLDQLSTDVKSSRRRKNSITISPEPCTDLFESKLSTLVSLLHECSSISLCALNRARLQSTHEHTWQKLTTIEHELETLIDKIDTTGGYNHSNSITTDKTLDNLLRDWKKYEKEFDQQLEQIN